MKDVIIIWSPIAQESYLKILTNILERWTIKEAEDFESKVESLIKKLKTLKHICPASYKQTQLRRCVITHQTSLVYRIRENTIEIVAFIDNRSEHPY
jgi:plasmid stabilization system protein ParE